MLLKDRQMSYQLLALLSGYRKLPSSANNLLLDKTNHFLTFFTYRDIYFCTIYCQLITCTGADPPHANSQSACAPSADHALDNILSL